MSRTPPHSINYGHKGQAMSKANIRPAIGTRCAHEGAQGEVRATYPSPQGICVVGRYDEPHRGETHFVCPWVACAELLERVA